MLHQWLRGVQCDKVRKIKVLLWTQRYSALLHMLHPIPSNYKLSELVGSAKNQGPGSRATLSRSRVPPSSKIPPADASHWWLPDGHGAIPTCHGEALAAG